MPMHLRWELYPIAHDRQYKYGGSYLEEPEWWTKPHHKFTLRSLALKLRDYLVFPGYFRRDKVYWFGLCMWHFGFYFIIIFHMLCFFGALFKVTTGLNISVGSLAESGKILYYLTLVFGIGSFILGTAGSLVMLIKRLVRQDLRAYSAAANYFNYVFFLIVFLSGLVNWVFFDPTFSTYRELWRSLITFRYLTVEPAVFIHVVLFSLFLIYLPFTRSTHYITKFFSYFGILWDDTPNLLGKRYQKKLNQLLNKKVNWSAEHIQSGNKWSTVVNNPPVKEPKNEP